jgi:hypothetical protein
VLLLALGLNSFCTRPMHEVHGAISDHESSVLEVSIPLNFLKTNYSTTQHS